MHAGRGEIAASSENPYVVCMPGGGLACISAKVRQLRFGRLALNSTRTEPGGGLGWTSAKVRQLRSGRLALNLTRTEPGGGRPGRQFRQKIMVPKNGSRGLFSIWKIGFLAPSYPPPYRPAIWSLAGWTGFPLRSAS